MSKRHEQNEARARLIVALYELSEVNPYHGLLAEEVVAEILDTIADLEQTPAGADPYEAAHQAAAVWWDTDWDGDPEAEQKWEYAVEMAVEVLRVCCGLC